MGNSATTTSNNKKPTISKRQTFSLAALVALSAFAIDTYLPAIPSIASDLNTGIDVTQSTISLYLAGVAVGQLFGGPISDRFGRKPVGIVGIIIFILASIAIALCSTITQMLFLRFIQAIGGGAASVIVGAIVRDSLTGKEGAKMMALIALIMMIAPLVAPAIGALVVELGHWRMIFVGLAIYASIALSQLIFTVKSKPPTGVYTDHLITHIYNSYIVVLSNIRALPILLCIGFSLANLFVFLSVSAFIYMEFFSVSVKQFPLYFGAGVVAIMLFNRINVFCLRFYEPQTLFKFGLVVQFISVLSLNIYVQVTDPQLLPFLSLLLFNIGMLGFVGSNGITEYLAYFPEKAGTANALVGIWQFSLAGIVGVIANILHDGTLIPVVSIMMVMVTLSLILIPWIRHASPNS